MRNATLITCNKAGVISTGMIWHDETDENETVQLTIGDYIYTFNNEGKLQNTTNVQICISDKHIFSCVHNLSAISCDPNANTEEKTDQINVNYDVNTEQKRTTNKKI